MINKIHWEVSDCLSSNDGLELEAYLCRAVVKFGLNNHQTCQVFILVNQNLSNGVATPEEVRRHLCEYLPIFGNLADSAGMSGKEFDERLSKGIPTSEFIPVLIKALKTL